MSALWKLLLVGSQHPLEGAPTWNAYRTTDSITNEGDACTMSLSGTNLVPGNRIIMWWTDPLAPSSNWTDDWWTVVQREVARQPGLTAQRLALKSGIPSGQGTLDVLFTVTADYQRGSVWYFTNSTRRNRADNQSLLLPDKSYGRDLQILIRVIPTNEGGDQTVDGYRGNAGSYYYVRDTSRTPLGLPSINISAQSLDGGPPIVNIHEGDSFRIVITGTNVTPNTVLKIYAANVGQNSITPGLRQALPAAATAAGCAAMVPNWTPATAGAWFNGGLLTFTARYPNNTPMIMTFTANRDNLDQPPRQLDIIANTYREGDIDDYGGVANYAGNWNSTTVYNQKDWVFYTPTGRKFFYKASISTKGISPPTDDGQTYENDYWREYVPVTVYGNSSSRIISDLPPKFWGLRATTDGTTITYTIQGPHGSDSSVAFSSTGAPPGFESAMANALTASGFMTLTNGRLSSTNPTVAEGAVTFTVPHSGSGKHLMQLSDAQGTVNKYIIIGDACVFLTPPASVDTITNLYGVNASGGEFGALYTPNHELADNSKWGNQPAGSFAQYNGGRYYYPSSPEETDPTKRHLRMDYHYQRGARYLRVPFNLQRVQRVAFGPLYYGDPQPFTKFGSQDMQRLIELATYWLTAFPDTRILFDAHNFGSHIYNAQVDADGVFTSDSTRYYYYNDQPENTPAALVDFWVRFVSAMLSALPMGRWDIDFMNEPIDTGSDVAPTDWANTMQWLTNAVRGRTNYLGIIHREGTEYSSAQNWVKNGNAAANLNSYDPAKNMVFHVHSYLDKDASGTSGICAPGGGVDRISSITNWARNAGITRANGSGLFLGETAAGAPSVSGQQSCGPLITAELQYILDNADVWLGFAWWGTGFGASYPFSLDPSNGDYLNPVETDNMIMVSGYWKTGNKLS